MTLEKLYNLAEVENVQIFNYNIDESINGIFLNYDELNVIGLNFETINNTLQEKCVLCEELAHYYMDATYNYRNVDIVLYDKQEYRAKKWSYNVLVPLDNLKSAILKRNR